MSVVNRGFGATAQYLWVSVTSKNPRTGGGFRAAISLFSSGLSLHLIYCIHKNQPILAKTLYRKPGSLLLGCR